MVIANLRLPTLMHLLEWLKMHLHRDGRVIVSGVRDHEWARLKRCYGAAGLHPGWSQCDAGWAGGYFQRVSGD